MAALHPEKIWWTPHDIAAAVLPDVPNSVSGVDRMIKRDGWRTDTKRARRRGGSSGGGGWEYHWELLPIRARQQLLRSIPQSGATDTPDTAELRREYDQSSGAVKAKAQSRLTVLRAVLEFERTGLTRSDAVKQVAFQGGASERSIWNYLGLVDGVAPDEWLFHLRPRNNTAQRKSPKTAAAREFMDRLKSLFLRLEGPSFAQCYRDAKRICAAQGWDVLTSRTARRRLYDEVPRVVRVYAREGEAGLARCFPPQKRDKSMLHAMQAVNADCHKFDVFVRWLDGLIARCQIVAFQDVYSGKVLSWRIDHTPNEVAVMAAFGEMVETYGIPSDCTFDNGREFASKWLSGGAKTRYRGKIRADDPLGVLPMLGITIHWAMPGHGQAKPVERTFRDFASDIAKDVRFAGAYVGNRPDAQPENYGSKAIDIERFIQVVDERIKEHNARCGRQSETAKGRSFDQAFAESYERSAIRRATDEHKRLWLMGQRTVTLQRDHGRAHLFRNYYWSDWMAEMAGQKVVARFDIEDLHSGVYIYALTGEFMGYAPCKKAVGFYNLTEAKQTARARAAWRRAKKRELDKARILTAAELGGELDALPVANPVMPVSKIVQMPRGDDRPAAARALRPEYHDEVSPDDAAQVLEFEQRFRAEQAQKEQAARKETARDRFRRALDLERRIAAGAQVGDAARCWLSGYQAGPEYRGERAIYDDFGDAIFAE